MINRELSDELIADVDSRKLQVVFFCFEVLFLFNSVYIDAVLLRVLLLLYFLFDFFKVKHKSALLLQLLNLHLPFVFVVVLNPHPLLLLKNVRFVFGTSVGSRVQVNRGYSCQSVVNAFNLNDFFVEGDASGDNFLKI